MRRSFGGGLLVVVAALAVTSPASAHVPGLDGVRIVGDPVVGSTLTGVITGTIDPSAVAYRWCHQGDRPRRCAKEDGTIGSGPVYVPVATDVGEALLVKVTARGDDDDDDDDEEETGTVTSPPSAPVSTVPSPSPDPTPDPTPEPTTEPTTDPKPTPDGSAPAPTFASAGGAPIGATVLDSGSDVYAQATLRYLAPFPVVRIRGSVAARGAWITMLKVTASEDVRVHVRCDGSSCPIRRRTHRVGRIRALERYLTAGTRITIRVRRPGLIGKYVQIVIRAGEPPSRHDACVVPGSSRPVSCGPA